LTTMTFEMATAKLGELGLVVAVESEKKPHPDIPADQVSAQVPAAGEKVAKGTTVALTVSAGQQRTLIPDIYGRSLEVVKERLERYGMVIGKVTGDGKKGLRLAEIDGKKVSNRERVVVGRTVDLTFP
ncbi:MAG: PASTA domain-containing protein, partial [Actinomycetota bacterium]